MTKMNFYDEFESYIKGSDDSKILTLVNSDKKGDAVERMNIYRDSYRFRLVDVLFGDFPTLHKILGDDDFSELAFDYVKKYPSTSFTIRNFGQYMSKYLLEEEPYKNHGYLTEMADFEWSKGTAFDAPDSEVFTMDELASISVEKWPTAKFKFIPAIKRLIYSYDVPQIWKAINDDNIEKEPIKLPTPLSWVMWRQGLNPSWYSLDVDESWALSQAQEGADFSEICDGLSEWIDEQHIAERASTFIKRWTYEGLLQKVVTD